MDLILKILLLVWCFQLAALTHHEGALSSTVGEEDCVIELKCSECIPDNMPVVTSHAARGGRVVARAGDEISLSCGGGRFLVFPHRDTVTVECRGGRYRLRGEGADRHILELGCQEDVFEDVQHDVPECSPPLQGRMYRAVGGGGNSRHVAALCFDSDRVIPVYIHLASTPHNTLPLSPHVDRSGPLSLLGNFNHMFDTKSRSDAERLFSDDVRLTRRLTQLFKHEKEDWAGQTLTSASLLASHYLEDQNMRVASFVSNKVPVWSGVAQGNLKHLQQDIAGLLAARAPQVTHVYAGTHKVLAIRTDKGLKEIFLKPGRFPVPKYIWTVVHDQVNRKALALILLNDPLVAVSDIREAVFCESQCGVVPWLTTLTLRRHYERPAQGLVFCCAIHSAIDHIPEIPKEPFKNVPIGNSGLLL